ncbi:hypothetical protein CR513_28951, partial [Mucuna pruriens]
MSPYWIVFDPEERPLSQPKSAAIQFTTKAHSRSSTNHLYDLDPEIEKTLCSLRKARTKVVHNSSSSDSISNNSSLVTNTFDSIEYSSTNNFLESEQMENNDRTLKELATPSVVYQPWCIQYPQLEPTQTYELKSSKDPHKHLKEFHMAFPFSLDGAAKDWLYLQSVFFNT